MGEVRSGARSWTCTGGCPKRHTKGLVHSLWDQAPPPDLRADREDETLQLLSKMPLRASVKLLEAGQQAGEGRTSGG